MSKEKELTRYYLRLKTFRPDGTPKPWEEVPATSVQCTPGEIALYATLRSQETGCEVRVNKESSLQGHYYAAQLARDTTRLMTSIFGNSPKPDNHGDKNSE